MVFIVSNAAGHHLTARSILYMASNRTSISYNEAAAINMNKNVNVPKGSQHAIQLIILNVAIKWLKSSCSCEPTCLRSLECSITETDKPQRKDQRSTAMYGGGKRAEDEQ